VSFILEAVEIFRTHEPLRLLPAISKSKDLHFRTTIYRFHEYFVKTTAFPATVTLNSVLELSIEVTMDLVFLKLHIYGMSGNVAFADCYRTAVGS